ncbi:hypothetical protein F5Y19DRAFT_316873 [Xylariaceae sp. FL1651]|nr:hypothetical protein F5Y19DRAFT_316873 [Xylariaceae sp. FL1651]
MVSLSTLSDQTTRPPRSASGSDSGYESPHEALSWDLKLGRPFDSQDSHTDPVYHIIWHKLQKSFGRRKKSNTTSHSPLVASDVADFANTVENDNVSRSGAAGNGPKWFEPTVAELDTRRPVAELEASHAAEPEVILNPSQGTSNRPGGWGGTNGSHGQYLPRPGGGAGVPAGQTAPGSGRRASYSSPPHPIQGRWSTAHSNYYDPNFPHAADPALLEGNITRTNEVQVNGIDVKATYNGPADARAVTANLIVQRNMHLGTGDQIIGLRVRTGARVLPFSGVYRENETRVAGEQIIGVQLE